MMQPAIDHLQDQINALRAKYNAVAQANGALQAQHATPPPERARSCAHSLLECGECRAASVKAAGNGAAPAVAPVAVERLCLDLGCGPYKKAGFVGVDCLKFDGVDVVLNIGKDTWPWPDSSVDEVYSSHTVEHLRFNPEFPERIHFVNELWRVLKPDAKATLITPHWSSCRQYGDYTHREPVSEFWPPYLQAAWRKANAPHDTIYTCNFNCTQPGYTMHPELALRSAEYRNHALQFFKEAAQDMILTLVAVK